MDEINFEEFTGSVRLNYGHSIVMGNKPRKIKLTDVSNQLKEEAFCDIESFGLFEVASPNYSTYYPDVTAEDLNPKDEEFIHPLFRMLSETIVSKHRPIDFGKPGVLKASMKLLLGQTVNIDHETAVGNAIGSVSEVYWQNAYKTSSGILIPAGINATLKIDGKSNPRIARGIMMNPPSIHSNSVTIRFKWEPSHKFEDQNEFYNKLGTYDDKGELVRCVAVKVLGYSETSLVGHGADTYAQKIDKESGEIVNPKYANDNRSFSATNTFIKDSVYVDYKTSDTNIGISNLSKDNAIPKNNNNNTNKTSKMEEILKQLGIELGLKEGDLTEANVVEEVKKKLSVESPEEVNKLTQEVSQLKEDITEKDTTITNLEAEVKKLKDNGKSAETILEDTRKEAVRLYKLCKGDSVEDTIINLINEAGTETVTSFVRQYQKEADEKFGMTCQDCKSTNVARQSATTSKEGLIVDGKEVKGDKPNTPKTNTEILKEIKNQKKSKSRIFYKEEEK